MEEYKPEAPANRPSRHKNTETEGKLIGGSILVGLGVIFLLHSLGMWRLHQSWPLILIVIGAVLIVGTISRLA